MNTTYYTRKASGICPACTALAQPGKVYCPDCIGDRTHAPAWWKRPRLAKPALADAISSMEEQDARHTARLKTIDLFADHGGPLLLCCGEWQPISTVPFSCRRCHRLHLDAAKQKELSSHVLR